MAPIIANHVNDTFGSQAGRANVPAIPSSTDVVTVRTRPEAVALVEKRSAVGDVVLFENDLPDHYP